MKNNPSGISSFYRCHENSHHTLRMAVDLTECIDAGALRGAVDIAAKRYDYFSVRFIRREGELLHSVVHNPRPIVITHGMEPVLLLTEEANEHALAIAYEGKTIYFDIVHSITDATGFFEFVKTTLYYYLTEKYGRTFPRDHIRTADMPVTDEERDDPFLNLPAPKETVPTPDNQTIPPAVEWETIMPLDRSRQAVYRMSVPEDAFMEYCRAVGGTPSAVISSLFAQAVCELAGGLDDPFRVVLMKDYRPILGTPLAHNKAIGNIILNYTADLCALPLDRLCAAVRQMAAYQSTEEYALSAVQKQLQGNQRVLALGDYDAMRAAFQKMSGVSLKYVNLTLSYMRLRLPEALEPYVEAVYTYLDPSASNIVVEMNAVSGRFCLSFLQNFAGDSLARTFAARLEQAGLAVCSGAEEPLVYPRMKI